MSYLLTLSSSKIRLYPFKTSLDPEFEDTDGHILVTRTITLHDVLEVSSEDNWSKIVTSKLKRMVYEHKNLIIC